MFDTFSYENWGTLCTHNKLQYDIIFQLYVHIQEVLLNNNFDIAWRSVILKVHVAWFNPFRMKTPKYLFPRGNEPLLYEPLLYHQIGIINFFIFITNQ